MWKLFTLLVAALFVLGIVVAVSKGITTTPVSAASASIRMTTAKVDEATSTYAISERYPQFGIPSIDTEIKAAVDKAAAQFKELPANSPSPAGGGSAGQHTFSTTFDSAYVGPDIVSTELLISQYAGGAHPVTAAIGLNFYRQSGKELTFDDALSLTGLSLQQLAAKANAELAQKLGSAYTFPQGASAEQKNYQAFVVSADAVTFMFQEYQVAPYAAGIQSVRVPRVR